MKRFLSLSLMVALSLSVILSGCGGGSGGGSSSGGNGGGTTGGKAGELTTFNVGKTGSVKSFNMSYVPAVSSFPTGTNDAGKGTVNAAYLIAETEVTYELWLKVYDWAKNGKDGNNVVDSSTGAGQYKFANAGTQGATIQHPVLNINWYDAMVWCNALTEYFNWTHNTSLTCVYTCNNTILRDATNTAYCNAAIASESAKGFRLPTNVEWELAARYIDGTRFYPGSYASGADAAYNVLSLATNAPDYDDNGYRYTTANVAVYNVLKMESDSESSWWVNTVTSAAPVKSKIKNALNLYDMSGNVWEWCFDLSGSNRVLRGGAWDQSSQGTNTTKLQPIQIGYLNPVAPSTCTITVGLRPVRTL